MKSIAYIVSMLAVGISFAQTRGLGGQTPDGCRWRNRPACQTAPAIANTSPSQSNEPTPIRLRLRDPQNCQAAEGRPMRQRLRDPATCRRINDTGTYCPRGIDSGRRHRGMESCGRRLPCCPNRGCCGRGHGRHHGWGGR